MRQIQFKSVKFYNTIFMNSIVTSCFRRKMSFVFKNYIIFTESSASCEDEMFRGFGISQQQILGSLSTRSGNSSPCDQEFHLPIQSGQRISVRMADIFVFLLSFEYYHVSLAISRTPVQNALFILMLNYTNQLHFGISRTQYLHRENSIPG